MELFIKWLKGDLGELVDNTYKSMHIITTIVVFVCMIVLAIIASSKLNEQKKRNVLKGIAIFQLVFEILWRLIYYFMKDSPLKDLWPMYPCNLGGVLLPIICLFNLKTGKKLFYLFGFVGGVITFIIPDGIFNNAVFVFPILKSVLQHTGVLAIPLFEYMADYFKPSIKDARYILIGLLINVFNAGYFDYLIGLEGDFMFLEMKIPFEINGVPQIIITTIFAAICLLFLSIIINIKEFKNLIKHN